jgi:site-specific DNA recombinase
LTNEDIRSKTSRSRKVLKVAWRKSPSRRRREILLPASEPPQDARPMRSENRALLITSIARGRRWLNELVTEAYTNTESIATRERFSVRKINMTISLAFLAPDLGCGDSIDPSGPFRLALQQGPSGVRLAANIGL